MSDGFRFWTHGVSVIPEYTKEYTGTDNGLYMRRAGFGAVIRQNVGTSNWFHFAIPSATELDDDNVSRYHAWLRFKINTGAVITNIHVRENNAANSNCPVIWQNNSLSITGQDTEYSIDLPDTRCYGPLVICVRVVFEAAGGEVTFTGAGGHFEEWT
jgi:hypothetical protein